MSKATITENTLGIAVGREGRNRRGRRGANAPSVDSFRRAERTVRTTRANQSGLGGRHLSTGVLFTASFSVLFLLWRFGAQWSDYPEHVAILLAWLLCLATATVALVVGSRRPSSLPKWIFPASLASGAIIVALDMVASWGGNANNVYLTAAPAVGALLLGFVTVYETRPILAATGVLGLALTVYGLVQDRLDPNTLAADIVVIALAVIPPILGVFVVRTFRRMVQLELDLVLVQSTVSQSRFTVGMLASEELARLDLDAEELLDGVAAGRTVLPLPLDMAGTASSLATQLRLHLIKGRKETWLHHAISESEFLGPSVSLYDPNGLAGLMAPVQRDALLLTIWLLISDAARPASSVSLTLGPILPSRGTASRKKVHFPIELSTSGVPRRRVDPETWQAIRVVGPHVDSIRDGSLQVDIECSVDNPADTQAQRTS